MTETKPGNEFFPKGFKWYEYLAMGWPIALMFVGGAVGGGCGGAAYVVNCYIFKSKLSTPMKYVCSFLVGIGAIILYMVCVMILLSLFPAMRRQ